jgi:hypothetical protein
MDDSVFIVDRIEHGNGGVCGTELLDTLSLKDALTKRPSNYGVYEKWFGFWPVISSDDRAKNILYRWEEDTETWELY